MKRLKDNSDAPAARYGILPEIVTSSKKKTRQHSTFSRKLAWTGDAVQETFAEGDPQSNGAAENSVNLVKGHVRLIKLAVESASSVEVSADQDLLTWLVPCAASMHRRFAVGRDGKTVSERNVGRRAVLPLAQFGERV